MEKRRKKILTAILSLLLIAVYLVIFRLSADDGENSSRISMKVSKTAVSLYYRLRGGGMDDAAFVTGAAACVEGAVRKLAHFTDYMAVGSGVCGWQTDKNALRECWFSCLCLPGWTSCTSILCREDMPPCGM